MKYYDYLIVGAGLFGAVFAYEKTRQGKSCLLLERRSEVGGNLATKELEGITVHQYGPHIFHTKDREIWDFMQGFCTMNHFRNAPLANYKGKLYNLPFNMNTFYALWAVVSPEEAAAKLAEQTAPWKRRLADGMAENLEEQALSLVGPDIYETLLRGYSEKQWGRPCHELPAFLIKRLPLRLTYDNNYFDDPYQGIPEGGYGSLFKQWLAAVDVELGVDFRPENRQLRARGDVLVYSGRLDRYYDYRFGELTYRSLRFEHEVLDMANYQGNAVINYTDAEIPYTRIVEHKHFAFGQQEKTVVTREFPCGCGPDDEPYYPFNSAENQALYERYRALAAEDKKLIVGGRLGDYAYYNMDEVLRRARYQSRASS